MDVRLPTSSHRFGRVPFGAGCYSLRSRSLVSSLRPYGSRPLTQAGPNAMHLARKIDSYILS
jgi:hypothetical protein